MAVVPSSTDQGSGSQRKRAVFYSLGLLLSLEFATRAVLTMGPVAGGIGQSSSAGWRLDWLDRPQETAAGESGRFHPTLGWDLPARGPTSVAVAPGQSVRPDRRRLVVLGDPRTFDHEALGEIIPEVEVSSVGAPGYGHDQLLLALQEQSLSEEPDLVLLGFAAGSPERNLLTFRDFAKPYFVLSGDQLSLRNVPVPTPEAVRQRHRIRPRVFDLLTIVRDAYLWQVGLSDRRMTSLTTALLDEMMEESVGVGSVFVFVYLPEDAELADPDFETDSHALFATYCEERAAFCLDLLARHREAAAEDRTFATEIEVPLLEPQTRVQAVAQYLRDRNLLHL